MSPAPTFDFNWGHHYLLKMKFERQKLVPWLIQRVESGKVPGLHWLDKERTKFRVTWKHAGKPDFDLERDAALFRMWAEHTGKYKRGEQPDPSTWKTRFRCALRKMTDIEEIRVPHSLDEKEPYRVFRLKSKVSKSTSMYSVLDTPTPSPTNDSSKELSSFSSLPAYSNQYVKHSSYDSMTCNPSGGVFDFPSPNSSHNSSPDHASDISNSSGVFSDDEDNIDNITPTLPPLEVPSYQHSDYRMINNELGGSLNCTNPSLGYYPIVNGSCSQPRLNFAELQSSGGVGYNGGGSGDGMYQGIPYSDIKNVHQQSDFTINTNNGFNASSQMGLFLKMLHTAATSMEIDRLECELTGNTAPGESSMEHSGQQMAEQDKQSPVTPPSSYSENMVMNDIYKIQNPDCNLSARVFYGVNEVATFHLDKDKSAMRVFYGKQDPALKDTAVAAVYNHLYGTGDMKQVRLPEVQCFDDTQQVLVNFNRGLVLEMSDDGNIWATRKSLTKVFFSSASRQSTKLNRDFKTKLFDFIEFQQALQESHNGIHSVPSADVTLTLGWPNGLTVFIVITHARAKMLLDKMNDVQSIAGPSNVQQVIEFTSQFVLSAAGLLDNSNSTSVKFL